MRRRVLVLLVVLGLTPLSSLTAQSLTTQQPSYVAASDSGVTPSSVVLLRQPWSVRQPEWAEERHQSARVELRLDSDSTRAAWRMRLLVTGMTIGGVAVGARLLDGPHDGLLGAYGSVLLLPFGVMSGIIVGGTAGYVVGHVLFPR